MNILTIVFLNKVMCRFFFQIILIPIFKCILESYLIHLTFFVLDSLDFSISGNVLQRIKTELLFYIHSNKSVSFFFKEAELKLV